MSNFLTDPDAMRDYSGRFHNHAGVVEEEAKKAWASSQNIAGAGWGGQAQGTSSATMEEMQRAFRNIVDMLQHTSDTLGRNATEYETREHESSQILSS
ncbi:WXG100 family type VII secretion target [Mycobacterium sp. DSM 3803]|nr:WXG100 family type VII secretion target [Mycobacterium sp. DSM 3803]